MLSSIRQVRQFHCTPLVQRLYSSVTSQNISLASADALEDENHSPNRNFGGGSRVLDASFGKKHLVSGISRVSEMVMSHAKGCYVYDKAGKEYLDFTAGFAVTSTGHSHPHVVKAIADQASKFIHAQYSLGYHQPMLELMSRLKDNYLPKELDSFFFWNSGTEAVEASMKIARMATRKSNFIAFQGGYHGRTFGSMGMSTSKNCYSVNMGPFIGGIHIAPYPYSTQLPKGLKESEMTDYCIEQFELLLQQQSAPSNTAACIIEPILGEGGYVPAPKEFLQKLRKICTQNNILMIVDEVQTGYGRTGKMWAHEHSGIVPDIMTVAKGIASGMPFSAVISRSEFTKNQPAGSMGGTYGGSIVSCAAALATLDVFEQENLIQNSHNRGRQMKEGLESIAKELGKNVKEVRGMGLMLGMEFQNAEYGTSGKLVKEFIKNGLLVFPCSAFEVIRFSPALTVSESEVNKALEIVRKVLKAHFTK